MYRHFKKTHKVLKHTNENNIEVLVWKRPGSSNCAIYYHLVHGGTLVVLGDLGDAIYNWYSSIDLEWISGLDLGYFAGKCQASEYGRVPTEWDKDQAEKELKEHFSEIELDTDDHQEVFNGKTKPKSNDNNELYNIFVEEYGWEYDLTDQCSWVSFVNNNDTEELFFDQDAWEWVYKIGQILPVRIELHLLGLKKAFRWIEKDCYHMWE